jgi:hypothetical protein
MLAVSNTSPISNLACNGRLDLLRAQCGQIWVPKAVEAELADVPDGAVRTTIDQTRTNPVPDGLPLEYKRDYGTARRNLNLSDLVNNLAAQGKVRIFSLGLPKEFFDCGGIEPGSLFQNLSDSVVIGLDPIQPLK